MRKPMSMAAGHCLAISRIISGLPSFSSLVSTCNAVIILRSDWSKECQSTGILLFSTIFSCQTLKVAKLEIELDKKF
mgnify:CR=1 FL=1